MQNSEIVYFPPADKIPRIVSATVKQTKPAQPLVSSIGFNDCSEKAKISGDVRIVDKSFRHLRYAEVRDGSLLLYRYVGRNKVWDIRIPLYNLNISLDSPKHYRQFSLSKFQEVTPLITLQVVKEQDYMRWLKVLAVEIIKQTPMNTLKFLDVLIINEILDKHRKQLLKNELPKIHNFTKNDKFSKKPNNVLFITNGKVQSAINRNSGDFRNKSNSLERNFTFSPNLHSLSKLDNELTDSGYYSSQCVLDECDTDVEAESAIKNKDEMLLLNKKDRHHYHLANSEKSLSCTSLVSDRVNLTNKLHDKSTSCGDLIDSLCNNIHSVNLTEIRKQFHHLDTTSQPCVVVYDSKDKKRHVKGIPSIYIHDERKTIPDVLKDLPESKIDNRRHMTDDLLKSENANSLIRLLTKCQIDREYVPVKEKKILFESMSKFSLSMDNLMQKGDLDCSKYQSLRNLDKSTVPVRVMKSYFEEFNKN